MNLEWSLLTVMAMANVPARKKIRIFKNLENFQIQKIAKKWGKKLAKKYTKKGKKRCLEQIIF
jgi:UDP-galactopyranose mutase